MYIFDQIVGPVPMELDMQASSACEAPDMMWSTYSPEQWPQETSTHLEDSPSRQTDAETCLVQPVSFEEETYGTEVIDVPVELVERLKGDWAERMQELSNVPVRLDLRDGTGRAHIGPGLNIGYATGQIVDSLMVMLKEFQEEELLEPEAKKARLDPPKPKNSATVVAGKNKVVPGRGAVAQPKKPVLRGSVTSATSSVVSATRLRGASISSARAALAARARPAQVLSAKRPRLGTQPSPSRPHIVTRPGVRPKGTLFNSVRYVRPVINVSKPQISVTRNLASFRPPLARPPVRPLVRPVRPVRQPVRPVRPAVRPVPAPVRPHVWNLSQQVRPRGARQRDGQHQDLQTETKSGLVLLGTATERLQRSPRARQHMKAPPMSTAVPVSPPRPAEADSTAEKASPPRAQQGPRLFDAAPKPKPRPVERLMFPPLAAGMEEVPLPVEILDVIVRSDTWEEEMEERAGVPVQIEVPYDEGVPGRVKVGPGDKEKVSAATNMIADHLTQLLCEA